jgi:hypothetical protein
MIVDEALWLLDVYDFKKDGEATAGLIQSR